MIKDCSVSVHWLTNYPFWHIEKIDEHMALTKEEAKEIYEIYKNKPMVKSVNINVVDKRNIFVSLAYMM